MVTRLQLASLKATPGSMQFTTICPPSQQRPDKGGIYFELNSPLEPIYILVPTIQLQPTEGRQQQIVRQSNHLQNSRLKYA